MFGNLNSVSWASQTQVYKYDPYNRSIARIQNGNFKSAYIYGFGNIPLAELNENGRIINVYLYADGITPIAMHKAGTEYYYISDIRGSPRMVVKSTTGEIRQKITYDSFGRVLEDTNPGYTPFGYAGGIYDYRTDIVRFGARDYQPETGRWTSEDPIGFFSGEVNFYAYVANDPVNYVDVNGLSKITSLVPYDPANLGALGPWERITLMPGQKIDRYGQLGGKHFSPVGTPLPMRALYPTTNINQYSVFQVVKPFEVQTSTIAPAFGKIRLGVQYYSPVSAEILWKRGIITLIGF